MTTRKNITTWSLDLLDALRAERAKLQSAIDTIEALTQERPRRGRPSGQPPKALAQVLAAKRTPKGTKRSKGWTDAKRAEVSRRMKRYRRQRRAETRAKIRAGVTR